MIPADKTALPEPLAARWSVTSAELIADTRSSHVYRVERGGKGTAIVKILKPEGLHERPGMAFLAMRDGSGAVRLLDRLGDAALIEDAGHLSLREHRLSAGDEASNIIIADLVAELHAARQETDIGALTPLDRHFAALFQRAALPDETALGADLRRAAGIAASLLSQQPDTRPLHGDLHHENILLSPRGWLAIDPQGLFGDPAYDVANVFGNPDGAFADIINPNRIVGLARCFASVIGVSQIKIIRYAMAHAGLSISWSLERGVALADSEDAQERHAFLELAQRLEAEGAFSG